MKIIKTSDYEYVGYQHQLHYFTGVHRKELLGVTSAKIIDTPSQVVLFCKTDGKVEPSYATMKKIDHETIQSVMSCVLQGRRGVARV